MRYNPGNCCLTYWILFMGYLYLNSNKSSCVARHEQGQFNANMWYHHRLMRWAFSSSCITSWGTSGHFTFPICISKCDKNCFCQHLLTIRRMKKLYVATRRKVIASAYEIFLPLLPSHCVLLFDSIP